MTKTKDVVFTVRIAGYSRCAWYRDYLGEEFECVLEIVDKGFCAGQEIMFKVVPCRSKIQYIKLEHGRIVAQRNVIVGAGRPMKERA